MEELGLFKQHGGQAMVDLTLSSIFRDPVGLRRISRAVGVHVVMGRNSFVFMETGVGAWRRYPQRPWPGGPG